MAPARSRSPFSRRSISATSGLSDEALRLVRRKGPAPPRHLLLVQALAHVRRHGDVHHLRIGQVEARHQRGIFRGVSHLKARVVTLLLADGADRVALVVVAGKDQRFLGQAQEALQALVLGARVAILEVGAAGAADEQRVAGEDPVAEGEAIGIVGVAGRVERLEAQTLDRQPIALADPHRHDVDLALLAHDGHAAGAVAQGAEACDVVGMQMRVDRLDQPEVEFLHQLEIAVDLVEHRIDDQRLASVSARQDVTVGARNGFEQLPEDHRRHSVQSGWRHSIASLSIDLGDLKDSDLRLPPYTRHSIGASPSGPTLASTPVWTSNR